MSARRRHDRRDRRTSQGLERRRHGAAVGEQVRAPAAAAARGVLPVVVGENPPADRRRDQGGLAGGDRAARAAAHSAGQRRLRMAADHQDDLHQSPGAAAGREGASAPPQHECAALRARRIGRHHHRRRQAVPDGRGRPGADAGLDLARARSRRHRSDHLARCARRAAAPLLGTGAFQPGPVGEPPETVPDEAFAVGKRGAGRDLHDQGLLAGLPLSLRPGRRGGRGGAARRATVLAVSATSIHSTAAPRWN